MLLAIVPRMIDEPDVRMERRSGASAGKFIDQRVEFARKRDFVQQRAAGSHEQRLQPLLFHRLLQENANIGFREILGKLSIQALQISGGVQFRAPAIERPFLLGQTSLAAGVAHFQYLARRGMLHPREVGVVEGPQRFQGANSAV